MVLPRVHNHGAFQRATLLLMLTGAATAWVSADAGAETRRLLFVVIAVVTGLAAHQQGRSLGIAFVLAGAGSVAASALWPGLCAAAAELAAFGSVSLDPAGHPLAGAWFGLVSGVGLFFAHLGPGTAEGARDLDASGRTLVARAARAHQRIVAELAGETNDEARALLEDANRINAGVADLASRAAHLRIALAAMHRDRRAELADEAAAGAHGEAPTAGEVGPLLAGLEVAADRLQTEVRAHVVALERTALELLGRRAGRIAEAAAALTPVSRQLVDGGEHLRAQATALSELERATPPGS